MSNGEVGLREYLERLIHAKQEIMEGRLRELKAEIGAEREARDARWEANDRETALALQSIHTRNETIDSRLDDMNQLREQITSERGAYVTREAYTEAHEALRARVAEVESRLLTRIETTAAGLSGRSESGQTSVQNRIDVLVARLESAERSRANLEGRFWMLGIGLSVIVTLVNLVINYYAAHGARP